MLSSEIDRIIGMLFFLEHTGELHIIILSRRKKGERTPIQQRVTYNRSPLNKEKTTNTPR
jgi:hypothetical protein